MVRWLALGQLLSHLMLTSPHTHPPHHPHTHTPTHTHTTTHTPTHTHTHPHHHSHHHPHTHTHPLTPLRFTSFVSIPFIRAWGPASSPGPRTPKSSLRDHLISASLKSPRRPPSVSAVYSPSGRTCSTPSCSRGGRSGDMQHGSVPSCKLQILRVETKFLRIFIKC